MRPSSTGSPVEDVAYLTRSEHRVPTLVALSVRPRTRSELREMTGASSSTIRRTLGEFERRNWIRRIGYQYETTQSGAFVASAMSDLLDRIKTERRLRHVWQWLPGEGSGLTIGMCSDADVTTPEANDPYRPVNRFVSLLGETDRFRFAGFDVALLEPSRDELRRRIVDGMRAEIVDPPSAAQYIHSNYREHCSGPLESGNLTVRVHDDLPPYGICIFDRRVAIAGFDPDSWTVRVLVDTDGEEVRRWAESTYESLRREARPLRLERAVE